jgi:hypothetical protein
MAAVSTPAWPTAIRASRLPNSSTTWLICSVVSADLVPRYFPELSYRPVRTWKILDVMAPIAKAHGCSPARLSIAWLLARPVATSVIIGAKRLDQLQDNLAAAELILTQDELRQLDEVSVLPPEYPGWVLPFQGADRLEPVDRWERFHEAKKPH